MRLPILWLFLIAARCLAKSRRHLRNRRPAIHGAPSSSERERGHLLLFHSYEQCMTTLSGIGGYCFRSPYYHAAPTTAPPVKENSRPAHPRRRRHT